MRISAISSHLTVFARHQAKADSSTTLRLLGYSQVFQGIGSNSAVVDGSSQIVVDTHIGNCSAQGVATIAAVAYLQAASDFQILVIGNVFHHACIANLYVAHISLDIIGQIQAVAAAHKLKAFGICLHSLQAQCQAQSEVHPVLMRTVICQGIFANISIVDISKYVVRGGLCCIGSC